MVKGEAKAEIVQVPTEHTDLIKLPGVDEPTDLLGVIVEMYNKLDKIERAVA